jgi:hypothetical protein
MVAAIARRAAILVACLLLLATLPLGEGVARAQPAVLPVANADGPYVGVVGVPIRFTGAASTGIGLTFAWHFGDGTAGAGVLPLHAYAAPGVFIVTLTVRDSAGQQATATTSARVHRAGATIVGGSMSFCVLRGGVVRCRVVTPAFTPVCVRFVFVRQVGVFQPFCVVRVPAPVVVVQVPRRVVFIPVQVLCTSGCRIVVRP